MFSSTRRLTGASARSGYRIIAEFDNIGAVNVGTDVRMAGIKIGSVVAQELDSETFQARVTMMIDPKLKLAEDQQRKIASEGMLGSPYVSLEPGGGESVIRRRRRNPIHPRRCRLLEACERGDVQQAGQGRADARTAKFEHAGDNPASRAPDSRDGARPAGL